MNKNLIELNNNCGVVSDENGNISLISKESDSYVFEEILLKDNDLEGLNLKLRKAREQLAYNKQKTIFAKITNAVLVCILTFLYINLHSILSIEMLIPLLAFSYLPFKIAASFINGTRRGRRILKKKLTIDIEKMELEIPTLEKELSEIKEKSKYKVSTIDETKTPIEEICPEVSLPMDSYISGQHNKVRVLSLSKRK